MILSSTCTTLKRWTCLNTLELNRVSSCQERLVSCHNKSIIEVVNVIWAFPPCPSPDTVKCDILCTSHIIMSMFSRAFLIMKWSLRDQENYFIYSHVNHFDRGCYWLMILFTQQEKSREGGSDHTLLCALQSQETSDFFI